MRPSFVLVASLFALTASAAPVGIVMSHSGRLLDGNDQPVSQTGVAFGFSVWSIADSTDAQFQVWPATGEATCTVDVTNGLYSASLGDGTCGSALTSDAFPSGQARWLQISIGGVKLSPRLRIGTAPTAAVAAHALDAETLGGHEPGDFFAKTDDLSAAAVGASTLGDSLAARAVLAADNAFAGSNSFAGATTFGAGGDTTTISGGVIDATSLHVASVEGSGSGLSNLGQATMGGTGTPTIQQAIDAAVTGSGAKLTNLGDAALGGAGSPTIQQALDAAVTGSGARLTELGAASLGAAGSPTVQQALDARLTGLTPSAGIVVTPGSGTAAVGLANDASSLGLVTGGAMTATGGNVGIGRNPSAKLDVAGDVHASAFAGDGSALTNLSATNLAGTVADARLSANVARRDAANTFAAANTFSADVTVSGELKQPNRPYFVAGDSRGWVGGNTGWNVLVFNTVVGGNAGGWYNTSTGLFTAPVSGLYLCTASLYDEASDISPASYMHLTFGCNGRVDGGCGLGDPTDYTIFGSRQSGDGSYNASPSNMRWAVMNKGDTMQLDAYLGGSSGNVMYGQHSQWGCALFAE